jgi:UDP-glucose 4-epimerase
MNILITSATGFIGRHLSRVLVARHSVFGLTRSGISALSGLCVEPVIADLSDSTFSNNLPADIDCVIHLAQSVRYRDFPEGVADMSRVNIDATIELLEWARKAGVKQFVFASTANVYGETTTVLTESHPIQPNSFYGASKLAAEHLTRQYQAYFQVDILRLFTVYGPGQKGMLIPNIIERVSMGQPITLAEGVGLYLTPIYVGDVVAIIVKLIETPSHSKCRLLNVCGDKIVHLGDIVKVLEAGMGKTAHIHVTDEKAKYFTGNNEALKDSIDQQQTTDIETGLTLTLSTQRLLQ